MADLPRRDLVTTVSLGPDDPVRSRPPQAPAPAAQERYQRLELIGRGGMGVVWAARDRELDRVVALKLVREGRVGGARLMREARALARLEHPNVVRVYDVGTLEGDTFIAMERVDGVSLRRWLAQPRDWREVVRVLAAAARGLAAAHEAGIVHRDIKPDNVLVGHDGTVRVADFGLARELEDASPDDSGAPPSDPLPRITHEGVRVGTPGYLSPELLAGAPPDAAADQYGFGVTMHEALLGARPGAASAPIALPGWLRRAQARALGTPSERWPSMTALADELERGPVRARRRLVALAAAAAAALVAVALVLALVRRSRAQLSPAEALRTIPDVVARADAALARGAPDVAAAIVDRGLALVAVSAEDAALVPLFAAGARAARARGRGEEAALLDDAAARHPAAALLAVGEALTARKQHGRAVRPLERALTVGADSPHLDWVRFSLGRALWKSGGDKQRARTLMEEAARHLEATRPPDDALLARVRGWLARKQDKSTDW